MNVKEVELALVNVTNCEHSRSTDRNVEKKQEDDDEEGVERRRMNGKRMG